mmetsp:Transcript_16601/g.36867  ORF Transcript_16601/g.36867 Transcript_16601/m.36867 type:complete len:529 (-) Transcript_16601:42-1628(-)
MYLGTVLSHFGRPLTSLSPPSHLSPLPLSVLSALLSSEGDRPKMTAAESGRQAPSYVAIGGALAFSLFSAWYANRIRRSRWLEEEERTHGHEATHSVIDHFKGLILDPETIVEEANKRRTASYYLKSREAHSKSLVLGIAPHSRLVELRSKEVDRILHYWNQRNKSHRTIVAMCDDTTQRVLDDARKLILGPLRYSSDIQTRGVWIPELNIIPPGDMHVTIALPWWWHTIRPGNNELTRKLAARFKQTLLLEFHHPFQIELERILLLGGKVLVALWRCVGDRTTDDGHVINDRHGESIDPFVRLREEIIRCFTTESPDQRRQPLTYRHRMSSLEMSDSAIAPSPTPNGKAKNVGNKQVPGLPGAMLERQHTIERKTPGMGRPGAADGFIHTTLCRLPLECLSYHDVELDKVHRLCREASATLSGHRMVISKYRFLETMGEGGESNPCYKPLYDETIDAPLRHKVDIDGTITESRKLNIPHTVQESLTIGPGRNFLNEMNENGSNNSNGAEPSGEIVNTLAGLFEPPPE